MLRVRHIKNLDLPELEPYRTMRQSQDHYEQGIFVAEGVKVVRRLLESDFTVVSVLLPNKWLAEFEPLIQARPEADVPVYVVTEKHVLEELTGFSMFQGVLAVGRIPRKHSLNDVLERSPQPRLFAAVDGVSNAENLGALVRNCAAFNVQALIVAETSSSPFLRRAVRNSMGTIFQLPIVELGGQRPARWRHQSREARREELPVPSKSRECGTEADPHTDWRGERLSRHGGDPREPGDVTAEATLTGAPLGQQPADLTLAQVLRELRARGIRCIAAHPHVQGRRLSQADFTSDCCILFGSEGQGISPAALEVCDEAVAIPMPPAVDSLNVGAAAAIFLYEANRQRRNL